MRKILIKILFRLLDTDFSFKEIDDKKIDAWLARQHGDQGFREYFRKRDLQLMKSMAVGVDNSTYMLLLGQRLEALKFLDRVTAAHKKSESAKLKAQREKAKEAGTGNEAAPEE